MELLKEQPKPNCTMYMKLTQTTDHFTMNSPAQAIVAYQTKGSMIRPSSSL